ncbi:hypothetical protein ACIBG0_37080 [Nocardia sp. NPDC050630]|uniref:hypothetical protein n=1 Tax=Nocardia sp. NPDC050630 TaxID=3364321 RepID=UPI0037B245A3
MISRGIIRIAVEIRNNLKGVLGRFGVGAGGMDREVPALLCRTSRHIQDADESGWGQVIDAQKLTDSSGVPRSTKGEFDPGLPVGIRNLPPPGELIYIRTTGSGENYEVFHRETPNPIGIYKPRSDASLIRDEETASESSRMLGVGNVPYTIKWVGHKGDGVLQEYVPNKGENSEFETDAAKGIAAFDYIMAGPDSTVGDVLKGIDGTIVRVDNEGSIPDPTRNNNNHLLSRYVTRNFGEPLPAGIVDRLCQVPRDHFSTFLESRGHSREASAWATERLVEIQTKGKITGEAWGCAIVDDDYRVVYPRGYESLSEFWDDRPDGEDINR